MSNNHKDKQEKAFSWDSTQYERFLAERNLPIMDLLVSIQRQCVAKNVTSVLDLGCGGGNSTQYLCECFPNAKILGIDNSSNMLSKATSRMLKRTTFMLYDINDGLDGLGRFDVVFANASIQWICDQQKLFADIFNALNPKGLFGVQIPNDEASPFYVALRRLLKQEKWRLRFSKKRHFHSLKAGEYYDILSAKAADIWLWESHYLHILESIDDILQWYKGSGLRAYLAELTSQEERDFLSSLKDLLGLYFPPQKNGKILFRMPRLFMLARLV